MIDKSVVQRSPEWFAARKGRVTASIVGAILGLSPYMTRQDAMRSMVRDALGAPREFTGNIATEWGDRMEPIARGMYETTSCHDVELVGFLPLEDWAGVSPDGYVNADGGVEIKCPYGLRKDPEPIFKSLAEQPHYEAQVQFTLYVTGRKWWHFYQWAPAGDKLVTVRPDADWQAKNIPILRQFHAEFLHELGHNKEEHLQPLRVVIDTPQALKLLTEYDELKEAKERAEERAKEVLAELVALTGERSAEVCWRKLTLVENAGSVSYAKAVKELLPGADLTKWTGAPSSYWKLT